MLRYYFGFMAVLVVVGALVQMSKGINPETMRACADACKTAGRPMEKFDSWNGCVCGP